MLKEVIPEISEKLKIIGFDKNTNGLLEQNKLIFFYKDKNDWFDK